MDRQVEYDNFLMSDMLHLILLCVSLCANAHIVKSIASKNATLTSQYGRRKMFNGCIFYWKICL